MAPTNFKSLKGLKQNEHLAKHTTFKIGGPADLFYEARTITELIKVIKLTKKLKIPYFILAGGSNILVSDKGIRGLVVRIRNSQFAIRNSTIVAEAGVPLGELVKKTADLGLTGLEFAAGIPGTIGGAVRGNAGAWQKDIGEKVLRVKVLAEDNKVKWISQKDCQFDYRQSRFKKSGEIILAVELKLEKGNKNEITRKIENNLAKRSSQPKEPSAGCIFVNPKPQSAGYLIEQCELKGKKIGQAQISPQHANFIVNLGKAKTSDVLKLITLAKEKVKKRFGVDLQEEICLVGFD